MMTSILSRRLAVSMTAIAATQFCLSQPVDQSTRVNQSLDAYMKLPAPQERSHAEASEAAARAAEVRALDSSSARAVLLDRIGNASNGHDLAKYHYLLQQMAPALKSDFFARASAESNPISKRRFIRVTDALWGPDAVRFLVAQLDDKRPTEANSNKDPRAVRVCDIALNALDKNVGKDLDVHIGFGTGGGDTIVHDVPVAKRDEWIATFKAALIQKYGPELNVPQRETTK
jgi:hypothetical protein